MPKLDSITIRGFKSIASAEVELGQLNVVIGPNGSGKSNFIGAFSFLHAIREGQLQDYVSRAGGAEKVLHFSSRITREVFVRVSFQERVNQYDITLVPTASDSLLPSLEYVYFWEDKEKYSEPYFELLPRYGQEAGISNPKAVKTADWIRAHLGSWRLYHFHDTSFSSPMRKTADVNDNRFLRPDASNLAAFLHFLSQKHETSYSLIRSTVQRVAPFFDDFTMAPEALNPDKIRLEWRHRGSDAYFDAASLSDGTLRFIALATLFLQPEQLRPSIILIDEPELGLHPYAITMLASLVKQAAARTQVIISTQSSLLLDHFDPEDVLVADRRDESTQFSRLDPKQLAHWLEDYSLGQLWEKNELGGRPAAG